MLWGMGQMGPVLVSVSFTLNSVTKLNSVNPRARAEHLDTVLRAPALMWWWTWRTDMCSKCKGFERKSAKTKSSGFFFVERHAARRFSPARDWPLG